MRTTTTRYGRVRPGFTVIEGMVVFAVILTLTALAFVAGNAARRSGRAAGEQQLLRSLGMGVTQFKSEFGFVPPLVDDQISVRNGQPNLVEPRLLEDDTPGNYSVLSVPYYLMGLADFEVNGSDGPMDGSPGASMTTVLRDGAFARKGRPVNAPVAAPQDARRVVRDEGTRVAVLDAWGIRGAHDFDEPGVVDDIGRPLNAIRYYRWEPTYLNGALQSVSDLNIPEDLGGVAKADELRGASYAIVSVGPDGEMGTEDDIVEAGK